MKKIIIGVVCLLFLSQATVFAFLYEGVKMLPKEEIAKLTDDQLMEAYVDAKIEEETSREFHFAAGFNSAKEYNQRKALLRFVFDLRMEMSKRANMDADTIDEKIK